MPGAAILVTKGLLNSTRSTLSPTAGWSAASRGLKRKLAAYLGIFPRWNISVNFYRNP